MISYKKDIDNNKLNIQEYSIENKLRTPCIKTRGGWLGRAVRLAALYAFMAAGVAGIGACDLDNGNGGTNEDDDGKGGGSQYTDMNQYTDELKNMFAGTFKGIIENGCWSKSIRP